MTTHAESRVVADAVKTVRFLAVDAVERANSGHPGMPMGTADIAVVLWSRFLRFDPAHPQWPDRDRFVLSAGHGCMLLYALLHLSGYELSLEELRRFRQWGSRTPGHPEFGHTPGVEATTGPLGQGVGNAVGMALAANMLAARFNGRTGFDPVTHRVFALASDGDLQEGISGEASSLAGHLGLGNLIVLYDDNRISIEGSTSLSFSEDVCKRYEAYGWHVAACDGHDHAAIAGAIDAALAERSRPSMIRCRTHIAFGSPGKQDSAESHGAPLGAQEVAATKAAASWPAEPSFHVPHEVREWFAAVAQRGAALCRSWDRNLAEWRAAEPKLAEAWDAHFEGVLPADLPVQLAAAVPNTKGATRAHGGAVLQRAAALVPNLVGGSADLTPSTKTAIQGSPSIAAGKFEGRNLHFGIREHGMGAILNGMLYHGAFRPYGSTFLVFADYMRPSIRIAALSGLPAIYVFTHDSIFVGEDGPTHQPIEQVWSLRLIPNLDVWRPADAIETAVAWGAALTRRDGPSALILTRQNLPQSEWTADPGEVLRGGHVVVDVAKPRAILAATGSEVHLAAEASRTLASEGIPLRVVSLPCVERFHAQPREVRERVFPDGIPVATIEAGRTLPWRALTGPGGMTIGLDRFGASAPDREVAEKLGLSVGTVVERLRGWLR